MFVWSFGASVITLAAWANPPTNGPTAFVISGGNPIGNFCSMTPRLDAAGDILSGANPPWTRTTFINDGPNTSPDAPATALTCNASGATRYDSNNRPILSRPTYRHPPDQPATLDAIRTQLRAVLAPPNHPNPLLFYIHNHGNSQPEPMVTLWGGQTLKLSDLRALIAEIPDSTRVMVVSDSCFGGSLIGGAIRKADGSIRRNTCGFSSASPDEWAWDDGTFMDMAKQVFSSRSETTRQAIDKNDDHNYSFGEIHRYMKRSYFAQSTPISSGDIYLASYVEKENDSSMQGRRAKLLSHCVFTATGQDKIAAGLSEPFRGTARALLHTQTTRLKSELANYYAGAGIPAGTPYPAVHALIADRQRKAEASEDEENAAYDVLKKAKNTYIRQKMGPKDFDCWQVLKAEIANGSAPTSPNSCTGLPTDPAQRQAAFTRLDTARGQEWAAIKRSTNPAFARFVREEGNHPPNDWPPNALTKWEAADAKHKQAVVGMTSLRRLDGALKSTNALEKMVDRGDSKAMMDYLSILECEETPMGRTGT